MPGFMHQTSLTELHRIDKAPGNSNVGAMTLGLLLIFTPLFTIISVVGVVYSLISNNIIGGVTCAGLMVIMLKMLKIYPKITTCLITLWNKRSTLPKGFPKKINLTIYPNEEKT